MATLQGQEIKDTYQALLKTDGNTNIDGTLQTITDGQGNATALSLSAGNAQVDGGFLQGTGNTATIFLAQTSSLTYVNLGTGSLGLAFTGSDDDAFLEVTFPFTVNFLGTEYTSSFIGSNSYLTFGEGSTEFNSIGPSNPPLPAIQINAGDRQYQRVYTGSEDGGLTYRIRYEGSSPYAPPTNVIYSYVFYSGSSRIDLYIDELGEISGEANGVTNGSAYVGYLNIISGSQYAYSITTNISVTATSSHAEGYNTQALGNYSHTEGEGTLASGLYSHAEGSTTVSSGQHSHAEGDGTLSIGTYSHTEGRGTTSIGIYSHAEGRGTTSIGEGSHAEGNNTRASGSYSHTEGDGTTALGLASHTEGQQTTSIGTYSHTEGYQTTTVGNHSHAEGYLSRTVGIYSHAEGVATIASGSYSHAEGNGTIATGLHSHAEGEYNEAIGQSSHTEGGNTTAVENYSHAEGILTIAVGLASHTEGRETTAIGDYTHAEGYQTKVIGGSQMAAHAEGAFTTATGQWSHAEGRNTKALNSVDHAEGDTTTAAGGKSHAEGQETITKGVASHAEGYQTTTLGLASHAEGWGTLSSGSFDGASGIPQHAEGRWNVPDTNSLLIVGNGTANNARRNAFTVTTFGTSNTGSTVVVPFLSASLNYANDTAAAAGGVPLGGLYRSGSFVLVRLV